MNNIGTKGEILRSCLLRLVPISRLLMSVERSGEKLFKVRYCKLLLAIQRYCSLFNAKTRKKAKND